MLQSDGLWKTKVAALSVCRLAGRRLADFLKELPAIIRHSEPCLSLYMGDEVPLESRVGLRELQTKFVYTTVLAKKCKVRVSPCLRWLWHCDVAEAAGELSRSAR